MKKPRDCTGLVGGCVLLSQLNPHSTSSDAPRKNGA